jgi:hypothetical protein
MNKINIAIGLLLLTMVFTMVWSNPTPYHTAQIERSNFLSTGQYSPKYAAYDDYAMLIACEEHGLSYNYEDAICEL